MFDQSLMEKHQEKRPWTMVISFGLQIGLIGIALLIPANAFEGAIWIEVGVIVLAVLAVLREIMTERRGMA